MSLSHNENTPIPPTVKWSASLDYKGRIKSRQVSPKRALAGIISHMEASTAMAEDILASLTRSSEVVISLNKTLRADGEPRTEGEPSGALGAA